MANLVLGFIGGDPIHRDNFQALLGDLISAHQRDHKGSKVLMILATSPFTDTTGDLADYCLTLGHQLGLVGHRDTFKRPKIVALMDDADGNIYRLKPETSLPQGLVAYLNHWAGLGADVRLITVCSDIDEDADVNVALQLATGKDIAVRSLLHGLDIVQIESTDEEEQTEMARRSVVEEDELEEEFDDDLEEDDFDDDDLDDDDGPEEEPDPEDLEEDDDEPEDDEPDDPDEEDDDLEDEDDDEDDAEDLDVDDESDDDESDDEEEEEVPTPKKKGERQSSGTPKWTAAKLERVANRSVDEFYEIADEFDVRPGRGQKISIMIRKVLEAQNGEAPARRSAPKAKPAAKTPARAEKKAPASKPAARRTPTAAAPKPATATHKARPAASGGLSKADVDAIAEATVRKLVSVIRKGLA